MAMISFAVFNYTSAPNLVKTKMEKIYDQMKEDAYEYTKSYFYDKLSGTVKNFKNKTIEKLTKLFNKTQNVDSNTEATVKAINRFKEKYHSMKKTFINTDPTIKPLNKLKERYQSLVKSVQLSEEKEK